MVFVRPGRFTGPIAGDNSFQLPALSSDGAEAMEEYYRHSKNGRWEKAFKALDGVLKATRTGLVARPDGILVPAQVVVQHALADLPAEGRAAYRLFHDADAKQLYNDAIGAREVAKLQEVITNFMATSVGPMAADRLGDLQFERGNMQEAVSAYRTALAFGPANEISRPTILAKLGIALVRSEQWTAVEDIVQELEQSHAGQQVTLGGAKLDPAQHLAALAAGKLPIRGTDQGPPADIVVAHGEPLWQFRPFGRPAPGKPSRVPGLQDQWGRNRSTELVIPVAAARDRIFANLLGCIVAIDLTTGKLVWRTSSPHELVQLNTSGRIAPEAYTIMAIGDSLWLTARDPKNIQMGGNLLRLEMATGKETLNSRNLSSLTNWLFDSRPDYDGQRLYAGAYKKSATNELHVVAIRPDDGKVIWSTQIGTKKVDENQYYYYLRTAQPAVVVRGGKVYVDTNCGAFAQLDAETGKLEWAVTYACEVPSNDYDYRMVVRSYYSAHPVAEGGRLYVKPMRANRVLAIDVTRPALLWNRPVPQDSMLVGVDDKRMYMCGEDFTAYDLESKKMEWACPLPASTSSIRPLLTANRIYQFTTRGVYEIDKATGRVMNLTRGADLESAGGAVLMAGQKLITSSNMAITAYETKPLGASDKSSRGNRTAGGLSAN